MSDFGHRFDEFLYLFWCQVVVVAPTATCASTCSLHSPGSSHHLEGQVMGNKNHVSILMRAVTLMNI